MSYSGVTSVYCNYKDIQYTQIENLYLEKDVG